MTTRAAFPFLLLLLSGLLGVLKAQDAVLDDSMYVRAAAGLRFIPAYASAFDANIGPEEDSWDQDLDLSVAWQAPGPFALELGFDSAPYASVIGSALNTDYLMPALRLPFDFLGVPGINTFGVKLGCSSLKNGTAGAFGNLVAPLNGVRSLSACYRLERTLSPRWGWGLEMAYTWVSCPVTETYEGYTLPFGPQWTLVQSAVLNLSGPSVKLSLSFWPVKPWGSWRNPTPEERHLSLVLRGDALMHQGRCMSAGQCYLRATQDNPQDRQAWQGLGEAYDCLGQERQARDAYERAGDLGGAGSPGAERP